MATKWSDFRETLNLSDADNAEIELTVKLIGKVIEAREAKGLSQQALADMCGIKQPVLARMEKAVHSPQINTLIKVLQPLGLTLDIVPIKESSNKDRVAM